MKKAPNRRSWRYSWLVAGLGWLLAFLVLAGTGGAEQASTIHCTFKGLPEATSLRHGMSLWPPGTKCRYTLPDGSKVTRTASWGATEWVLVAGVGLIAGLIPNATRWSRRALFD